MREMDLSRCSGVVIENDIVLRRLVFSIFLMKDHMHAGQVSRSGSALICDLNHFLVNK